MKIPMILDRFLPTYRRSEMQPEAEVPPLSTSLTKQIKDLLEDKRRLEIKIDRLERENRQLKTDIDDLVKQVDLKAREVKEILASHKPPTQAEKILFMLDVAGPIGATRNVIAAAVGLPPAVVSSRLADLEKAGKVVHDSRYRPESGPHKAKVWVRRQD
jgi:predicted Rossmann fold nucleotide-binding protein DprA/Smf involved in DNA uptake